MKTGICTLCGKEYKKRRGNAKYCAECAQKTTKSTANEDAEKRPRKAENKNAHTLAAINAAARAKHLSYGRYVSLYKL